jgi:hypothetical protein
MTIDHDTGVSMSPQPPQDGRWAIFVPASYKNMTLHVGDSELSWHPYVARCLQAHGGGKYAVDEALILSSGYRRHRTSTKGGSGILDDVRGDLAQTRRSCCKRGASDGAFLRSVSDLRRSPVLASSIAHGEDGPVHPALQSRYSIPTDYRGGLKPHLRFS